MPPCHLATRRALATLMAIMLAATGCARAGEALSTPSGSGSAPAAPLSAAPVSLEQALLAPADFAVPGWRTATDSTSGDVDAVFGVAQCPGYTAAAYPAPAHRTAVRLRTYADARATATNLVERYEPGWAARGFADIQRMVQQCGRFETAEDLRSYAIVDQGFVGADSLLVRWTRITPRDGNEVWYAAVVRNGDLVATVTGPGLTDRQVRALATRAAHRLN